MFQRSVIILFASIFLSSSVYAGVHWRNDPVFIKAFYIFAGIASIGVGAGVGGVLGSMVTLPGPTICCARLAACKGNSADEAAAFDGPSNEDICRGPIDCAKWLNQYQAGCDAEKALMNQPTIVGVGVGAGIGILGFTAFCLIKVFRAMSPESQRLINNEPKPGEIV